MVEVAKVSGHDNYNKTLVYWLSRTSEEDEVGTLGIHVFLVVNSKDSFVF